MLRASAQARSTSSSGKDHGRPARPSETIQRTNSRWAALPGHRRRGHVEARQRAPVADLPEIDAVDATAGALDDPGALERIGEQRISRARHGRQQIVDAHAFGEPAGVHHAEAFVRPLHVDGPERRVVAMGHRVGERFTEALFREVGDLGAKEVDELGRSIPRTEFRRERLEAPKERQSMDPVLQNTLSVHDLPGDLVRRHELAQRLFAAEEQECNAPDARSASVRLEAAERAAQIFIGQAEERAISAPAAFAHQTPEALDLERIEVFPRRARNYRRRRILREPVASRLEDEERDARGFAIAAECSSQVTPRRGRRRQGRLRDAKDEHRLAVEHVHLRLDADGGPGRVGHEGLDTARVGRPPVARPRSHHLAVVVDADEQRPTLRVREADDRFDEVLVVRILLEFDGERLAAGDELGERHRAGALLGGGRGETYGEPVAVARASAS
jgi:hypothetical protein